LFRFKPKKTETQSVLVVFRFVSRNQRIFFRFVSVFRNSIETNQKNLQKMLSFGVSSKQLIFFRFKPKQTENQSVSVVFRCVRKPKKIWGVCFGVSDRYRNNRNQQNLWFGELKRFIFKQICCCFGWSFFVSVVLKHRNSLFQYESETTETNVLFRIVLKLVSVVSIQNYSSFGGHPLCICLVTVRRKGPRRGSSLPPGINSCHIFPSARGG
jgi:hypothetical protein